MGCRVFRVTTSALLVAVSQLALAQESAPLEVTAQQLQDPALLVQQYQQGRILAFDLGTDEAKDAKKALMNEISGMVIGDNKMVYLRKGPQGTRFLVQEHHARPEKRARALEKFSSAPAAEPAAQP